MTTPVSDAVAVSAAVAAALASARPLGRAAARRRWRTVGPGRRPQPLASRAHANESAAPPGSAVMARLERAGARIASWPLARRAGERLARRLAGSSYESDLAFGLEAAARHARTGATVVDAVGHAARAAGGSAGADLAAVATAARVTGLRAALALWVRRRPLPSVRLAAGVLSVGFGTGAATARALDGAASAVRQRLVVTQEARSLTAQARLSARVLGVAPAAFAVVVSAIDPRVGGFLISTAAGLVLLAAGLLLDVAGMLWMRRLVATALA